MAPTSIAGGQYAGVVMHDPRISVVIYDNEELWKVLSCLRQLQLSDPLPLLRDDLLERGLVPLVVETALELVGVQCLREFDHTIPRAVDENRRAEHVN